MHFEVKSVIMIARDNLARGHYKAVGIGNRQDIAGLGTFASLISHTLTAFLGNGVRAIQVHLAQVQICLDGRHTALPDSRQAPIGAPFAPMVIHRLPTRFIACQALCCALGDWQTIPLAAAEQPIQNQVEYPHQRRFTHITSPSYAQVRQDILLKLLLPYTFWDSAHDWLLLVGVLPSS